MRKALKVGFFLSLNFNLLNYIFSLNKLFSFFVFFFKGIINCSVQQSTTIKEIKERVFGANKKLYPDRQGNSIHKN